VAKRIVQQMTPDEVLETQFGGPDTGVFTDGSCDPNPGRGGWGWVWVRDGEILAQGHGRNPATTNNRMELQALIEAFKQLPSDRDLVAYSDSQLCVNTINQWAPGWKKRGWKRKGGPIKNLELVQELYALTQAKPRVELQWIRAHEGIRWNEYADALAALGR
jgi:ribonuclease HI